MEDLGLYIRSGTLIAGWFISENLVRMDDLGKNCHTAGCLMIFPAVYISKYWYFPKYIRVISAFQVSAGHPSISWNQMVFPWLHQCIETKFFAVFKSYVQVCIHSCCYIPTSFMVKPKWATLPILLHARSQRKY